MKEFLLANWLTILILIAFVAYIIVLVVKGRWDKLRAFAYQMMLLAERTYSDNQGAEKFKSVFNIVYNMIPPWLQRFIPPESIREKLQYWYELAKDYAKDGIIGNE